MKIPIFHQTAALAAASLAIGFLATDIKPANAIQVVLTPTQNTYIDSRFPTTNYGTSATTLIGQTLATGNPGIGNQTSFYKFTLPTMGQRRIGVATRATLRLYNQDTSANINNVSIAAYNTTGGWNPNTLTFNSATGLVNTSTALATRNGTSTSPGVLAPPAATPLSGTRLTQLVTGWLNEGSTNGFAGVNNGIAVAATSTRYTGTRDDTFGSSRATTASQRPTLTVDYDVYGTLGWVAESRIGQNAVNSSGQPILGGSWETSTHAVDVATYQPAEVQLQWQDNTQVPFKVTWDKATQTVTTQVGKSGTNWLNSRSWKVGQSSTGQVSTWTPETTNWDAFRLFARVLPTDGTNTPGKPDSGKVETGTIATTQITNVVYAYNSTPNQLINTSLTGIATWRSSATGTTYGVNAAQQNFYGFADIGIPTDIATVSSIEGFFNIDWPTAFNPQNTFTGALSKILFQVEGFGKLPLTSPTSTASLANFEPQGGTSVPEPSSVMSLFAIASLGAGTLLRRKAKSC